MIGTKEKIKETALELFSREGYKGASIRQIAKAVGIRESAFYNHFKTKQELISSIFDEISNNAGGTNLLTDDLLDEIVNPRKFMFSFSEKLFRHWDTPGERRLYRLLLVEEFREYEIDKPGIKNILDESRKIWEMIFTQMIKHGLISKQEPSILANEFIAPLFFIRLEFLADERKHDIQKAMAAMRDHVNFFWSAINK